MAVLEKGSSRREGRSILEWLNDERVRAVLYQALVAVAVVVVARYLFVNTTENLQARGMSAGFDFLASTAGFSIAWSVLPYKAGDTYFHVFLVGITNTLALALVAIVFTTLLGFFVGVMRLSKNWLISKMAAWYVEILRNTPLLLQILFWFLTVFSLLPRPKDSISFLDLFYLNNRGLYMPAPVAGDGFELTMISILVAIAATYALAIWARKRLYDTGRPFPTFSAGLAVLFGIPIVVFLATGAPLSFDYAVLKGFNFLGGASVPPAFCALMLALVIYHSAYMAEAVRAGILSVSHGQTEASYSLGLRPGMTLRLVVIPQAMRAVVPPMISNWMNVVKNSSLAIAIGYPDLVAVFMQTSLNQSGHAIEIVAMVMLFYMTVSLTISMGLNYYNKRVQLKER